MIGLRSKLSNLSPLPVYISLNEYKSETGTTWQCVFIVSISKVITFFTIFQNVQYEYCGWILLGIKSSCSPVKHNPVSDYSVILGVVRGFESHPGVCCWAQSQGTAGARPLLGVLGCVLPVCQQDARPDRVAPLWNCKNPNPGHSRGRWCRSSVCVCTLVVPDRPCITTWWKN